VPLVGTVGNVSPTFVPPTPTPDSSDTTPAPTSAEQPTIDPTSVSTDCSGPACDSSLHCRSKWGHCGANADYCNSESTWTVACSGDGSQSDAEADAEAESEGEPESESEPESEAEPRDEDEQAQCFSALVLNRGVSDSDCAHCVGGRTYWPCNEEILCVCPSQCVFDGHWRCSPSLGQVKTVGHLRKVRTHGMLTSGNAFIQEANTVTLQSVVDEL